MVQVRFYNVKSRLANFKYCSLHDLMRDLSRFQAKAEDFYEVIDLQEGNDFYVNPAKGYKAADTRQLVLNCEGNTSKKTNTYFVKKFNRQQYRSMLISGDYKKRSFPSVAVSYVGRFKLLRICTLGNVEINRSVSSTLFGIKLGRVLGSLVYLRYLSVSYIALLIVPSMKKLVFLQTLNLDETYIYFPPWMSKNVLGKLKRLRHLYLPYQGVKGLGKNSQLRFDGLSKLETLENFNTNWCEVKDLPKLTSLQRLSLTIKSSSSYDLEEAIKYLSALALSPSSCLKQLGLEISCNLRLGSGPDMLRKLLSDHKYTLRDLQIRGQIPELGELFKQQRQQVQQLDNTFIMDVSLLRITTLHFMGTHLEEDPMPYLEKIPTLCYLTLSSNAFVGNEMVCSLTGFPKLTRLRLWSLSLLKKLRVEDGSMPILHTLSISRCYNLEELPEGLIFLTSLQRLYLKHNPEFCGRFREVNGVQGPEFYRVAHIPSLDIQPR